MRGRGSLEEVVMIVVTTVGVVVVIIAGATVATVLTTPPEDTTKGSLLLVGDKGSRGLPPPAPLQGKLVALAAGVRGRTDAWGRPGGGGKGLDDSRV